MKLCRVFLFEEDIFCLCLAGEQARPYGCRRRVYDDQVYMCAKFITRTHISYRMKPNVGRACPPAKCVRRKLLYAEYTFYENESFIQSLFPNKRHIALNNYIPTQKIH